MTERRRNSPGADKLTCRRQQWRLSLIRCKTSEMWKEFDDKAGHREVDGGRFVQWFQARFHARPLPVRAGCGRCSFELAVTIDGGVRVCGRTDQRRPSAASQQIRLAWWRRSFPASIFNSVSRPDRTRPTRLSVRPCVTSSIVPVTAAHSLQLKRQRPAAAKRTVTPPTISAVRPEWIIRR